MARIYILFGYLFDFIEPVLDGSLVELHYTAHHQGYTNKLNNALEVLKDEQAEYVEHDIVYVLKHLDGIRDEDLRTAVTNNGGGYFNHWFFWNSMRAYRDEK